jgi:hypothetical protein
MKITKTQLRRLIKETLVKEAGEYSDDKGGVSKMDASLRSMLASGNHHGFSNAITQLEIEQVPDMKEVAQTMYDGFLLDVSDIEGSGGGTYRFHSVIGGEMTLIGNVSLGDASSLSRPEFNIVTYPVNLEDF